MCIGKTHPFIRQTVHVWCWDFGITIVALQITITHIIHQDEHDMRLPTDNC